MPRSAIPPAERFERYVNRNGPVPAHQPALGHCWVWTGAGRGGGYGVFWWDASRPLIPAHRAAWELYYGSRPDSLNVCHHCDNRRCVRPEHLFLGTDSDNVQDALRKGRFSQGERSYLARLTENAVREIRAALANGERPTRIAHRYGVVRGAVYNIRNRTTWRLLS